MEYKVIAEFNDKDTAEFHGIDTVYKTDNKERATFLKEKGFLEKTEPKKTKQEPKDAKDDKNAKSSKVSK